MAYTLEEFMKKFEINYEQMDIEEGVSVYPRTILVPKCPECGGTLYLYHPEKKMDPFIGHKVTDGILQAKLGGETKWLATCWTNNCPFYAKFKEEELARCPECSRFALELFSLYDHMRFQCTKKAQEKETLEKAGVGMYISDLM
jgi:ssDNA-binding Zn-finger/Zn-ribbon topoisomerase 1